MNRHRNSSKNYSCQVCRKNLSSKQNLQQHIAIHTGENPLKCSFPNCKAAFKHASQLSCHKSIHRKDLPNRLDFTDFKSFIWLILEIHNSDHKPEAKIPSGPYTIREARLPDLIFGAGKDSLPLPEILKN